MTERDLVFEPAPRLENQMRLLAGLGVFAFVLGAFFVPERVWPMLLLLGFGLLSVALAGSVVVALHYVTGARWSVALRRIPEAMASLLPLGGIAVLLVLFFHPSLYSWTTPEPGEHAASFRDWWLHLGFFRARAIFYLLVWSAFIWALLRGSRSQDADGDLRHTQRNRSISAAYLVVFAITFCLASFDWIMSLEPQWYSTIFGFYNFAGLFLAGLAVLTILAVWLQGSGPLHHVITRQHLHDLGKLLFAFSTFWAYLWFSQYMLIWYANIPEETVYYIRRLYGFWQPLFLLNLFLNWVVPFFVLLPRSHKQRPSMLVKVALVLLAGRWLDLYLMIVPPFSPTRPVFGIWEITLTAGAVGIFTLGLMAALRRAPLVPLRDPYLADSLHYHS